MKINKINKINKTTRAIFIGLTIGIIISLFYSAKFFTRLELITTDFRRHLIEYQKNNSPREDIVFFFIDQKSIDELKEDSIYWPWPRKVSGDIIKYLNAGGAKLIVFDVLYTEPSVYGFGDDSAYSSSIINAGNVIVGFIMGNRREDEEGKDKDYIFNKALEINIDASNINYENYNFFQPPIEMISESVISIGSVNSRPDIDGLFRRSSLIYKYDDRYFPHISLAALYGIWDIEEIIIEGNDLVIKEMEGIHRYTLDQDGFFSIKYYGSMRETYQNYTIAAIIKSAEFFNSGDFLNMYNEYENYKGLFSEYEIIKEKVKINENIDENFKNFNNYLNKIYFFKFSNIEEMLSEIDDEVIKLIKEEEYSLIEKAIENYEKNFISPSTFKDKIIFIAGTAPGLYDIRPNPFNQKDGGVHIHATILNNLLNDDYYINKNKIYIVIPIIIILSVITSIIGVRFKIAIGISMTLSIFLLYSIFVLILFLYFNEIFNYSAPSIAVISSFIIGTVLSYIQEAKEKKFVKNAFGQYLSTEVIKQLIKNPEKLSLGGERKYMTAFFSDVQGFSSVSESISPEALVQLLNDYLSQMCNIISKYDGTVDKFEGDAIIAFWGAPLDQKDHAIRACESAVDMQIKMIEMRRRWAEEGKHQLKMRIGLNSGTMVVGNMGSNERMDYTMMGDAVNLASRLEGANKFYGTYSMISEFAYELVKDLFVVRELDDIRVIGKNEAVKIYELIGRNNEVSDIILKAINIFNEALILYREKEFRQAIGVFNKVCEKIPDDPPSVTYIRRCKQYILNTPPNNWDGVFNLTSKG